MRRARPLLGTYVEVGIDAAAARPETAFDAAFDAVIQVQRCLSRFDPESDIARFDALCGGASLPVRAPTAAVLRAAQRLGEESGGIFDITLGSGGTQGIGWHCDDGHLHKTADAVRLDLGGIGKGYAVDAAVQTLLGNGCTAGWVNAGGDLRAFGAAEVPIALRDERCGGARPFATLADGAFATSHFDAGSRSEAVGRTSGSPVRAHASVAAPLCLWADALTKLVALSGDTRHPLLARYGAQAWLHPLG
jgi:thiamine biosynthesis lipoprotein